MKNREPIDPIKQAEFDRLMNLAHINRRRGEYKQANALLGLAFELIPGSLEARELAADLLYAAGKWPEAAEAYKTIFQEDSSRTAAEEKYAKVLLQIAEGNRQQELIKDMLEHPEMHRLPDRSPWAAALLSGLPGFGHVYCGQVVKGVVLLLITAICWLLFLVMRPNVSALPDPDQRILRFTQDLDPLAVIFLLIALGTHTYAIVNAAVTADKLNARNKGIL